jgi:endonuclease-3
MLPKRVRSAKRAKVLRPRSIRGVRPYSTDEVDQLLAKEYGPATWRPRKDGVSELVLTILSQHTSDLNSDRAFDELWNRFGSWAAVMHATPDLVADAIRSGGLAEQKAPRIQGVLREVLERCGRFDISFLSDLPLAEAKSWLRSLPGVGPKTAAVVLCFALGMPAFPVDTHIHRVALRVGLIGPRVSADKAHDVLEVSIDSDRVYPLHVYLITHGRRVCKSQRPLCDQCVLAQRCPSRGQFAIHPGAH